MAKTRQQKQDNITALTEKLGRAKSVIFANYQGLTMAQLSQLRNALRSQGSEFTITKNTLLELALKASQLPVSGTIKVGATATLFNYEDEITPIKALVGALKDAQKGGVKSGLFAGELMDQLSVIRLANLPSKLELRASVVGSLSSPLYGIVGVLQANLRNLVYTLSAIQKQKGGEQAS